MEFDIILIGQKLKKEHQYLDAGEYAYPFRFAITQNMPASFKTYQAKTEYSVVSTLGIDSLLFWYFNIAYFFC
jgi:hypothetical protein